MSNVSTRGLVFSVLSGSGFGLHHHILGRILFSSGSTVVLLLTRPVPLVTLVVSLIVGNVVVGLVVVVGFSS